MRLESFAKKLYKLKYEQKYWSLKNNMCYP